jgi:hypothetical protein
MDKYGKAEQATDDTVAHALSLAINTHREY